MACERLGREQRADAAGAVEDDRRVAVGRRGLDLLLEVALGDVAWRPGMWPSSHSLVLAHVDEARAALASQLGLAGADLADGGARLAHEVSEGLAHRWMGSESVVRDVPWVVGRSGAASRGQAGRRHRRRTRGRCMCAAPRRGRIGVAAPARRAACCSVSIESSAHLRRAGLISMPRRSSTSCAVRALSSRPATGRGSRRSASMRRPG